jgi:hypothetical protein
MWRKIRWATHTLKNSLGVVNLKTGNVSMIVKPEVIFDMPIISVTSLGGTDMVGHTFGDPSDQGGPDDPPEISFGTHIFCLTS